MLAVQELESRHPQVSFTVDIQQRPGDPMPAIIGGFRPDAYAVLPVPPSIIIVEAKTDRDLDNSHTDKQLAAFVAHLEQKKTGSLVLSVTGPRADDAKTVLRFLRQTAQVQYATLSVYDGCDLWSLDQDSGVMWHLS